MKIFLKNWYFLFTIPLISYVIGFYIAYKKNNVYKAQAEIIVHPSGGAAGQGLSYYQYFKASSNLANQKRILQSYDLTKEAIGRLKMGVSYFQVGKIKTREIYPNENFEIDVVSQKTFMLEKPIFFNFNRQGINVEYEVQGETKEYQFKYGADIITPDFHYRIVVKHWRGVNGLKDKEDFLYKVVVKNKDRLINQYRLGVRIYDVDKSSALKVAFYDFVEKRAVDFLDTLIHIYENYSMRERIKINKNTQEFIDIQLNELAEKINQTETELEYYKIKENIFDANQEKLRFYNSLIELDQQLESLTFNEKSISELQVYIQKSNEKETFLPPAFFIPEDDQYVKTALSQLSNMQFKKAESLYDFKEDNPEIDRSDNTYDLIKQNLMAYLENLKVALKEKKIELNNKIAELETILRKMPESQREILNIQRKIQVNENLYNFLLEQKARFSIEKAAILPDSEMVDSPRSLGVVSPDRNVIKMNSLMIGIGLVIAIGAIRFLFFDKAESLYDLKERTNLPVIAGVPQYDEEIKPGDKKYIKSPHAESYRKARTNLQLMTNKTEDNVILISSMFPSEGKTFNSIQMAGTLATSGKKVILVDFDLHKPSVHKKLDLSNDKGVSLLLSNRETDYKNLIQPLTPSIDVLTSGPLPPNASDLISAKKFVPLVNTLKTDYDYVILDTPPLHLILDARVLSEYAKINLLVINVKNASYSMIKDVEEFYDEHKPQNFALILNGIRTPMWVTLYGKYNYKYAYKYGYGYGYSYGYNYYYHYGEKT